MSQIAIWTILTLIGGLSLLIGAQTFVYAQGNYTNGTTMGNATNSTGWTRNATTISGESDTNGNVAGIRI